VSSFGSVGRRYLQGGVYPQKPVRRAYERICGFTDGSIKIPSHRARSKAEKAKLYWGTRWGPVRIIKRTVVCPRGRLRYDPGQATVSGKRPFGDYQSR